MLLSFFSMSLASFFAGDGVAAPDSSFVLSSGFTLTLRLSNIPHRVMSTSNPCRVEERKTRGQSLPKSTIPALTFEQKHIRDGTRALLCALMKLQNFKVFINVSRASRYIDSYGFELLMLIPYLENLSTINVAYFKGYESMHLEPQDTLMKI